MPLYHFHLTEGDELTSDPEGSELVDHRSAERAAMKIAGALIAEAVSEGQRAYSGRLDVQDERGADVLAMTFSCPVLIEPARPAEQLGRAPGRPLKIGAAKVSRRL